MQKIKIDQTRHKEETHRTDKAEEMVGKYTAERVVKTWAEEFVDEGSGEVTSIDRHELIMEKGTLLDADNLQKLVFSLQAKEINSVLVSNQQRTGEYAETVTSQLWEVIVYNPLRKAEKCYLYAESLLTALEVAKDYHEQKFKGSFSFKSIKPIGFALYLQSDRAEVLDVEYTDEEKEILKENSEEVKPDPLYRLEVDYRYKDKKIKDWIGYTTSFIVEGENAEKCKEKIEEYFKEEAKENPERKTFKINILTANIIKVNEVVSFQFCKNYFNQKKE